MDLSAGRTGTPKAMNLDHTLPEALPRTLAGLAEHMRADAIARFIEHGPDDLCGHWLWELADKTENLDVKPPVPRQRRTY